MSQLAKIREQQPLVHNMTNQVVANQVANGLLALGASPIMAYEKAEMEDIVSLASCLVLNIGTITETTFESMLVAGKVANQKNIPVVLDPVGVGASQYRRDVVKRLLEEPSVDAFIVNCKRRKIENDANGAEDLTTILKFAGTVENQVCCRT